ncbi:Protoheme IX farnesyltransferase [Aureliella helgolandensis]|uniref:Heme o synthase n=2 Tax=Aureliella helgolandensis TaxID=2527968 RepID=A0A518GH87_9BACT|nr:Protoheme IX farnesyltransferase [Aureliella helgolandensis]
MILVTVIMAMVTAGNSVSMWVAFHACLGTALVAASASVMNQWLERDRDAVMNRTCRRPLPSGNVASSQAAGMGWVLVLVGSVYLAVFVNLPTMWCGLATWGLYVWVYTPLKMLSWTNTLVGTLPGALPVWMGWTAAEGSLIDVRAWILLGVVVAWQLPHFMAIAYMYREQYAAAGYKMITVTDPSGRGAAWHAILGSLALIVLAVLSVPPVGLFASLLTVCAVAVALWQTVAAIRFVRAPDMKTARRMLHVSLLHLPLTMLLILLSYWIR